MKATHKSAWDEALQDQDALKEEVAALKEANTHLRETFDIGS